LFSFRVSPVHLLVLAPCLRIERAQNRHSVFRILQKVGLV
jgi:hypothetical protein